MASRPASKRSHRRSGPRRKRFPQASLLQQGKYIADQPVESILEIKPRAQNPIDAFLGQRLELVGDFAGRAQDRLSPVATTKREYFTASLVSDRESAAIP